MIRRLIILFFVFSITSCGGVEFVLKNNVLENELKNKTALIFKGEKKSVFEKGLISYIGNVTNADYYLVTNFIEKKENRLVKKNQVAEKIEYTLKVDYELFYQTSECMIFKKTIKSKFYFTPKSSGYNFGSERSFDRLYSDSVNKNINNFINVLQINKSCLR